MIIETIKKLLKENTSILNNSLNSDFSKDKEDIKLFNELDPQNKKKLEKECKNCGWKKLPDEAIYCPKCGKKIQNDDENKAAAESYYIPET